MDGQIKIRTEIEAALLMEYIAGNFDREEMARLKRDRFASAGVSYARHEYPAVMKEIRDAIETAAANNAIEGYVLSREEIDELIREEIRSVLG